MPGNAPRSFCFEDRHLRPGPSLLISGSEVHSGMNQGPRLEAPQPATGPKIS